MGRGGAALADLDHDGTPEIVVGSTVLNADGTTRWTGSAGRGDNGQGPLALVADLDMQGSMEIIAGNTVYAADGTIIWRRSDLQDGFNALANFDGSADPLPEIVLVARGTVSLLTHDGTTIWGPIALPGGGAGGAPTIADMDGDGAPEIGVAGARRYTVFDTDGSVLWSVTTVDGSGTTGSSVFDFDGDGVVEVVYADEQALRIYRGTDGAVLWTTPSSSATAYEMPIVADVDADGNAELIKVSNNYFVHGPTVGIQVYGDANDAWVATRQIWNQHTYHVTNINDDGTIPQDEIASWTTANTYRLNTFLTGCATAQPDLRAGAVRVATTDTAVTLTAQVSNSGALFVPSGLPVAWYAGTPGDGGVLLGRSRTAQRLNPGTVTDVVLLLPAGTTTTAPIWVVADDQGDGTGIHAEQNEANNAHSTRLYLSAVPNVAPSVAAGDPQTTRMSTPTIVLSGTVTDDGLPSAQVQTTWHMVAGPDAVQFADLHSPTTTATFRAAGTYVLRLTADDFAARSHDDVIITITAVPLIPAPAPARPSLPETLSVPGVIGSPANQALITAPLPITLAADVVLLSGTLDYWPAENPIQVTTLAANVAGSGGATLATFDPSVLANGSYVVRLRGTDAAGVNMASGILVTVAGDYKPGRVRFGVTDLTVPLTGMPITIGRTYDSLERDQVGDFGHGWTLDLGNPRLTVDPAHNVTVTQPNGQRVTFLFAPRSYGGVFGAFVKPAYQPEPGVFGSLVANGCPVLVAAGGGYQCFLDTAQYRPTTYTYTDPYGRVFVMGADGRLTAVTDLNGNRLTITRDGITSSAGGVTVPFVRDAQGRITQITDPDGNVYRYAYDPPEDLVDVTLPDTAPAHYTYDASHLLTTIVDARGNTVATATYAADGRLTSETDAVGNTTRYAYDLTARKTTSTNPDGGVETRVADAYGSVVQQTNALGNVTTYTYDANHQLLTRTDALGKQTTYTYDARGNQTTVKNALGKIRTTTYNKYGGPLTTIDQLGNVETITYDASFMPQQVQDSLGVKGQFVFDAHGSMTQYTDANGATTSFTYDMYGNRIRVTDPLSHTTVFTSDQLGRMTASTTADGATTAYAYDALGRQQAVTDALGHTTTYQYDATGNQTALIDALGRRTSFSYDAAGRRTQTTFPDGTTSTTTYDWRGNPLTSTDQAGHTTRFQYDLAGQLVQQTGADGTPDATTTTTRYDAAGRVIATTDPLSQTTTAQYDVVGQLLSRTDPLTQTTRFQYDAAGRRTTLIDASNRTTRFTFDARGRQTITTYPNGTTTTLVYDGLGNVIQRMDEAGRVTRYAYDAAAHLRSVTNPLSLVTRYAYDPVGQLAAMTDANGHTTSFGYDAMGQLSQKTWADGTTVEQFGYDVVGNQLTHRLADGHTTIFAYDAVNRLVDAQYADGQTVQTTYTPTGQRATVTDGRGVTRYVYDAQDRLTSVTQPDGAVVQYRYDADGQRADMTTPTGTTTYGYDAARRLVAVTDPQGGTTRYGYSPTGARTARALPNGVTTSYTYNTRDQLTSLSHTQGTQTLARYTYTLAATGRRDKVVAVDGQAITWSYDAADRLLSETFNAPNGALLGRSQWSYDATGNRLTETVNSQTSTYQYNALDQLIAVGGVPQQYDGRGNLLNDGTASYIWDAQDRLTGVTLADGTAAQYVYDADGRRVQQIAGGQATNYLWDEASSYGDVVLETDASGTPQASYVLGDSELIAQERSGILSYYLHDGQGNVRTLTNATGAVTDQYDYSAFGTLRAQSGTTANLYRYTGQQFDATTGLYNLRARSYQPSAGRFLSSDTYPVDLVNPRELNRYGYVAGDPINGYDPSGLFTIAADYGVQLNTQAIKHYAVVTAVGIAVWCVLTLTTQQLGAPLQGPCTIYSGTIQIQGGDIVGHPGAIGNTLSFAWTRQQPLTAAEGLVQLSNLWNSLTRRQKDRRNQAYVRAVKYIQNCPTVGGCYPPGKSGFQNYPVPHDFRDARIDIELFRGRNLI